MTLKNNIFDSNILAINRNKVIKDFHKSDFIHKFIADLITEIILEQKRDFNKILEIGALDGYLSKKIKENIPNSDIFQTEISKKWSKLDNNYPKIIMNDEFLSFKENSFDLICSNLNAHFYNDLLGFFIQSLYCLKKKGFFITSFIAIDSLKNLKEAVNTAEIEKYQRFSPRFLPLTDIKTSAMLMQKAGFQDVVSLTEEINIDYDDPMKILLDIKNASGSNIMFDRSKKLMHKNFLNEILSKLEQKRIKGKININLNIIILFGWKK